MINSTYNLSPPSPGDGGKDLRVTLEVRPIITKNSLREDDDMTRKLQKKPNLFLVQQVAKELLFFWLV